MGRGLLAIGAIALLVQEGAPAQDLPPGAELREVIVTARKREESLQDVPLSVATLSAAQLESLGLRSDYDIASYTVGFRTLQQVGRDSDRPIIRGMASPPTRGEPNASYFIDGIYVSGSISTATTSAIERVEVLRGPQSAQFGRATFAGAVNYVTKGPSDTVEGEVNTRAGTHDDYNVGGWMRGPLIGETLYYVVSANWSHYGGQWHNQLQPGQASYELDSRLPVRMFLIDPPQEGDHSRLGVEETRDVLGKLVWRPGEGRELSLKYGYTKGEDSHFPSLGAAALNCFVPTPETANEPWYATTQGDYCGEWSVQGLQNRLNLPDFKRGVTVVHATTAADPADFIIPPTEPGTVREQHRVLLDYTQDLAAGYTLTARAGYNKDDIRKLYDLDHTENRAVWGQFHFDLFRDLKDYSAELRLTTPEDRAVRGSLGLYWYELDRASHQRSYPGPAVIFGFGAVSVDYPRGSQLDVTNQAAFGSLELDITEQWTLAIEGRYAEDEKVTSGGVLGVDPDVPPSVELSFDSFTPRITLRYEHSEDLTLYVLAAKGNKPGDFNAEFFRSGTAAEAVNAGLTGCSAAPGNPQPPFLPCTSDTAALIDEEVQWTYEVGAKGSWLDGRASANLAAYYVDWENQAVFTLVSILQNNGSYSPTTAVRNIGRSEVKGVELETNLRVTDTLSVFANYGYTDARFVAGEDATLGETTGDGDLRGRRVPNVPMHTVIMGARATAMLSSGLEVFLSPDVLLNSKRYTQPGNLSWIGNETTVNLRAGIEADDWTVTGYVRNLTDDDTPISVGEFINFGTVDVNYPVNVFGNLLNDRDPRNYAINPKRGRDWGVELQYRF